MSIAASDLILYGPANTPEDDTSTEGGAIDATRRPEFTQFSGTAVLSVQSDGADTRNITVEGRLATGLYDTEVIALNGTTPALGLKSFERILRVTIASTSGTRTVTLKQGSGGTTIGTIPVNEVEVYAMFINSASDPSVTKTRYEKVFWKNTHGSLTLTSATISLTADPASKITIGVSTTLNDTGTVTDRTTAPAGVSFVDDNISQNVVGGSLAAGDKQGVWIKQILAAGNAALKTTFTTQVAGNSI